MTSYLKGAPEKLLWTRDAKGKRLYPRVERPETAQKENYNLVLTIDSRIQHLVESHLKAAVKDKGAKGGFAIVMDPRTGEILALANEMGFDPNTFLRGQPRHREKQGHHRLLRSRLHLQTFSGGGRARRGGRQGNGHVQL